MIYVYTHGAGRGVYIKHNQTKQKKEKNKKINCMSGSVHPIRVRAWFRKGEYTTHANKQKINKTRRTKALSMS